MGSSRISIGRRSAMGLGLAAASALATGAGSRAEAAEKGVKVSVLYGTPKDPDAFEKYYAETHIPLVRKVKGIRRAEYSKGLPQPDGKPPTYYRIAEMWFSSVKQMQTVTATDDWKKVIDDVPNFATGGAIAEVSEIV
jgi:uncharacterized protein (TIGR02118 family)